MKEILSAFDLSGVPVSCERQGNGHINRTFHVVCDNGAGYILQRINTNVFHDVDSLMRNISLVTAYLKRQTGHENEVLELIPTRSGDTYYRTQNGECWRVYVFVAGSVCYDRADERLFCESGRAFGSFQMKLADFPANSLAETIPHFHDTPSRVEALKSAIASDSCYRRSGAQREIDFALSREAYASKLTRAGAAGLIPKRVTHNDTKINNILFSRETKRALCIVDLDTVMPGFSTDDFGDAIRYGANTAAEDERDLSLVHFDMRLFEAYTRGFLQACGRSLTEGEIALLADGAIMMTYECGVRFLADHLDGDVYFGAARTGHNLDRARTQFRLVEEMEARREQMAAVVMRAAALSRA